MIAKKTPLMTISIALLIQFGVQANDIPPALEFQDVVPTRVPIVLDGNITDAEWGHAKAITNPEFYIPKGSGDGGDLVVFEEYSGGIWEGDADHSTTTKFLYDSGNLYVSHLVVDDFHENGANSGWNGDSSQIMIATDDRQLQVALYNFALGGVEGDANFVPVCGPNADLCIVHEEAGPGGVDAAIARTGTSTSYEILLPAASLGLNEPLAPGTVLGFGVAINDGDEIETGQKGWGGLGAHSIVFGKTAQETAELTFVVAAAGAALQPGDADQDLDFDQIDLVKVQVAAKYLTGNAATWGEGDWNGGPGGSVGNPPAGDSRFNQNDIIAALAAGKYLTGKYAALANANGARGDGQTSIIYNAGTGEVAVDAPAGANLTSVNIDSAARIFTGAPAQNLGGSFDNDADNNIFKATFGSSFGSLSFGNVAQAGLSQAFVLGDLTVVGSLAGGGALGPVDLIYVPEPSTAFLVAIGALVILFSAGKRKQT
jgi:hypothetical protein